MVCIAQEILGDSIKQQLLDQELQEIKAEKEPKRKEKYQARLRGNILLGIVEGITVTPDHPISANNEYT